MTAERRIRRISGHPEIRAVARAWLIGVALVAMTFATARPAQASVATTSLTNSEGLQFYIMTNTSSSGGFVLGTFTTPVHGTYLTYTTTTNQWYSVISSTWVPTSTWITWNTWWTTTSTYCNPIQLHFVSKAALQLTDCLGDTTTVSGTPSYYFDWYALGPYYNGYWSTSTWTTTSGFMTYFGTWFTSTWSTTTTVNSASTAWDHAYDFSYILDVTVLGGGGLTTFGNNGPITTEESGREIVMGPQTIDNLEVTRKVYVPTTGDWVRHLVILQNPTGSAITTDLDVRGNLGSSAATIVNTTSSGDAVVALGDRWVTTSQGPAGGCCDPDLFHNVDGPGANDAADAIAFPGSGAASWSWNNVKVPAGRKKVYAFFVGGKTTRVAAAASAAAVDAQPNALKAGMSKSEKQRTRNWAFSQAAVAVVDDGGSSNNCLATIVPVSSSQAAASSATLLLLPLLGYLYFRRRRR